MTIYENVATEAIASFFYHEPIWKKEILFNFLLKPFDLNVNDINDVVTQEKLNGTTPDFTIITKDNKRFRYEVKINHDDLTPSERRKDSRDVYLIRKNYSHYDEIPFSKNEKGKKILYWEDLFEIIDKLGATKDFSRLDLVREYMHEEVHTLLLTPYEVAMLYSPETVAAVYTLSNKILSLCKAFLDSHSKDYEYNECKRQDFTNPEQDELGIGYYFKEKKGKKRDLFIGLDLTTPETAWSIGINQPDGSYKNDIYTLDKEILAKCSSSGTDEKLQEEFNKNAEEVMKRIGES